MNKREQIKAEIDALPDDQLDDFKRYVAFFKESRPKPGEKGLLEKLLDIRIDGPADFSENFDLYLNGEKKFEDDVR